MKNLVADDLFGLAVGHLKMILIDNREASCVICSGRLKDFLLDEPKNIKKTFRRELIFHVTTFSGCHSGCRDSAHTV